MNIFRTASLPLLHRGERLSNSPTIWFGAFALSAIAGLLAGHVIPLYALSTVFLLGFAFWFSCRLTREMALRALSAESCPSCEAVFGSDTASAVFAGYTRSCLQLIQRAKGAFSIDLGSPMDFVCTSCGTHLFFDYLGSRAISAINNGAEQ